ncbi:MAG: hypothetical protein ACOVP7_08240 [Lacibacter sp.]
MKQILAFLCMALAITSCNNSQEKTAETTTTDAPAAAEVTLPYTLSSPYHNWAIGSTENVAAAMAGLKAFVDKDSAALAASIGDSLELNFDLLQTKLSRDSAMKFFADARKMYNDLKVVMHDYVSVISADKKTEWVTIWYTQSWKDAKGVADSVQVVNDIRMSNGKMVELDEKSSRFQKKK